LALRISIALFQNGLLASYYLPIELLNELIGDVVSCPELRFQQSILEMAVSYCYMGNGEEKKKLLEDMCDAPVQ
jgi:hypothetical protein